MVTGDSYEGEGGGILPRLVLEFLGLAEILFSMLVIARKRQAVVLIC